MMVKKEVNLFLVLSKIKIFILIIYKINKHLKSDFFSSVKFL